MKTKVVVSPVLAKKSFGKKPVQYPAIDKTEIINNDGSHALVDTDTMSPIAKIAIKVQKVSISFIFLLLNYYQYFKSNAL